MLGTGPVSGAECPSSTPEVEEDVPDTENDSDAHAAGTGESMNVEMSKTVTLPRS